MSIPDTPIQPQGPPPHAAWPVRHKVATTLLSALTLVVAIAVIAAVTSSSKSAKTASSSSPRSDTPNAVQGK